MLIQAPMHVNSVAVWADGETTVGVVFRSAFCFADLFFCVGLLSGLAGLFFNV